MTRGIGSFNRINVYRTAEFLLEMRWGKNYNLNFKFPNIRIFFYIMDTYCIYCKL